eukprot:NODE_254_length_11700_cov_0.671580.p8 type:complete len:175 gc:universal NODE_254_length_11700_cov_0.671580:5641-6165(+)
MIDPRANQIFIVNILAKNPNSIMESTDYYNQIYGYVPNNLDGYQMNNTEYFYQYEEIQGSMFLLEENIDIDQFYMLELLQKELNIPDYCVILANYYFLKTCNLCPLEFDLMLTCLMIAYKFNTDLQVKNSSVEMFIGYNTFALNSLEAHVLQLLDYRLKIPEDELAAYSGFYGF